MFTNRTEGSITIDVKTAASGAKKLLAIIAKISKYVEGMHRAGRPIPAITIAREEYTALMDAASKGREVKVSALSYEGIPVQFQRVMK